MKIAIYPGTFDPITNGHIDILKRASLIFDKTIVGVASDTEKKSLFSIKERKKFIDDSIININNIEIEIFSGLLMSFVEKKNANFIIRGVRVVPDFEYEFQLALMNKKLNKKVETIFLMASSEYAFISSTIIKRVSRFHGSIKGLVPKEVENALKAKFK